MSEFKNRTVKVHMVEMPIGTSTNVEFLDGCNAGERELFLNGVLPKLIYPDATEFISEKDIDNADVIVTTMLWMSRPEEIEMIKKYKGTKKMLINVGAVTGETFDFGDGERDVVLRDLLCMNIPEIDERLRGYKISSNDETTFVPIIRLYDNIHFSNDFVMRFNPNVDVFVKRSEEYLVEHPISTT